MARRTTVALLLGHLFFRLYLQLSLGPAAKRPSHGFKYPGARTQEVRLISFFMDYGGGGVLRTPSLGA
ncbi:hypothetical protein NDU88_004502 [Pleurodeles waltl]|uniref:Secreted protein n=1 Tax=Pleurodeles waltl TaxID=8319 RepID=A0AAV7RGF2_PLEWA|nr:hypothetical protein NDU88_004502 [Pleurodeles waltl]